MIRFALVGFGLLLSAQEPNIEACASIATFGKETATEIAILQAKSDYIAWHRGVKLSGKESIFINDDITLFEQHIVSESSGKIRPHSPHKVSIKKVDDTQHVCVSICWCDQQ